MILRSPTENENGGLSFHMVPSSTRHSRARGNPGLLRRISLDTRFRGYDGTQAGLLVLIPKRVFSKEVTKSTKLRSLRISVSETFVAFVCFVVNKFRRKVASTPSAPLHRGVRTRPPKNLLSSAAIRAAWPTSAAGRRSARGRLD